MSFKKTFTAVLLSFLIAPTTFAQFSFELGAGQPDNGSGSRSAVYLWNNGGLPEGSIFGIVEAAALWLLAIFGILGIIAFLIAGILYLTSAGNEKQAEHAKSAMKWAIFGVIVGLLGFIIIQAVTFWLSEDIFF